MKTKWLGNPAALRMDGKTEAFVVGYRDDDKMLFGTGTTLEEALLAASVFSESGIPFDEAPGDELE
jgi:hypothetical protein